MWMLLRSPKMYGFIFGFQRCVWWPKWTPASRSWRIDKSGNAMPCYPFPVEPPQGEQHPLRECHRAEQSGFLPDNPMPYVWNAAGHTFDLPQKQVLLPEIASAGQ